MKEVVLVQIAKTCSVISMKRMRFCLILTADRKNLDRQGSRQGLGTLLAVFV